MVAGKFSITYVVLDTFLWLKTLTPYSLPGLLCTVADPGFPRFEGVLTHYLAKFFRKLHENEEFLAKGGKFFGYFKSLKSLV